MELIKDDVALLDKVVIYNFSVLDIDNISVLQDKGIVTVKERAKDYIHTIFGELYSSISIDKTIAFDKFTYAISPIGIYACLELSVDDVDGYHNLNCFTAEQYRKKLDEVEEFLESEYGIEVDFREAKYKKIEINKTIVLNHSYTEYQRVLSLLMFLLPGSLKLGGETDIHSKDYHYSNLQNNRHQIQTYMKSSGEKGLSIIIYDKKAQLEAKYKISVKYNYLRFEITLNSSTKIKRSLGTNSVSELTDSDINKFFSCFIDKNVRTTYLSYQEKKTKELKKIIKKHYRPNSHTWVRDTLLDISNYEIDNNIPLMLDIAELIPLLDDIKFANRQIKYSNFPHQ